jgi:glutathione S-transferase kappa 1
MKVKFYYDVVSPYSFLAFTILCRYEKQWEIELDLHPFFLGGVLKATGNTPPAMLPARGPYLLRDLFRQSQYYDLPLQIPSSFPANTILPMRFLTAVKAEHPQMLRSMSCRLWQHHYGEGQDMTTDSDVRAALAGDSFDSKIVNHLLEKCSDQKVKDILRAETESAVEQGGFGAPTFFIPTPEGDEMFFGSDRFHLVAQALNKSWDGPFPKTTPR